MATGRLGVSNPSPNVNTLVYTVPNGLLSCVNICVVNMGIQDLNFTAYISDGSNISLDRLLESNCTIAANGGVLEREGILLTAGETIYVQSSTSNASVRIHGYED